MTENVRRQLRWTALLCGGLGLWAVWKVIQIIAWPQWIEVTNSSSVVAKNVKVEAWERGGKLVAHRQWSRLSPGRTVVIRLSQRNVTAKLSYTLDYGPSSYHERGRICSKYEGWMFRIMPNGVVLSQNANADGTVMDRFFPRVY